jgi:hypothetical protein
LELLGRGVEILEPVKGVPGVEIRPRISRTLGRTVAFQGIPEPPLVVEPVAGAQFGLAAGGVGGDCKQAHQQGHRFSCGRRAAHRNQQLGEEQQECGDQREDEAVAILLGSAGEALRLFQAFDAARDIRDLVLGRAGAVVGAPGARRHVDEGFFAEAADDGRAFAVLLIAGERPAAFLLYRQRIAFDRADADGVNLYARGRRLGRGAQGVGVVVLAVGQQDQGLASGIALQDARGQAYRGPDGGARHGDGPHGYPGENLLGRLYVRGQRAEYAGVAREGDDPDSVSREQGHKLREFPFGLLQTVGRDVFRAHGQGRVHGYDDLAHVRAGGDQLHPPLRPGQGQEDQGQA